MDRKELPLFEFDGKEGKVRPDHYVSTPKNLPERCVIAFSKSSVAAIAEKHGAPVIAEMSSCTVNLPIYEVDTDGVKIALITGFLGSAGVAGQIHELCSAGVKKIIACGSAGTLTPKPLGALVIPDCAVRDEGASYHYAPPSYEIKADAWVVEPHRRNGMRGYDCRIAVFKREIRADIILRRRFKRHGLRHPQLRPRRRRSP